MKYLKTKKLINNNITMSYYIRRLQKVKTGSYMISLPMSWIKQNNLDAHAHLIIVEKPSHLIIKRQTAQSYAVINVDEMNHDDSLIMYMFTTYYIHGTKLIRITANNASIPANLRRRIIDDALKLIGVRLSEAGSNYLLFEIEDNIHTLTLQEFQENIKKIITTLILALYNIKASLNNITDNILVLEETLENLKNIEYKYKYMVRLLSRMAIEYEYNIFNSLREVIDYVLLLRDLDRMRYHTNNLISHLMNIYNSNALLSINFRDYLDNVLDKIINVLNMLSNYLVNGDFTYLINIRNVINDIRSLISSNDKIDRSGRYTHMILYELRRILGYCVAIMDDTSQIYLVPRFEFK